MDTTKYPPKPGTKLVPKPSSPFHKKSSSVIILGYYFGTGNTVGVIVSDGIGLPLLHYSWEYMISHFDVTSENVWENKNSMEQFKHDIWEAIHTEHANSRMSLDCLTTLRRLFS